MNLLEAVEAELDMRGDVPRHLMDYFPEEGPNRRELYPKHMEYFAAGPRYRERLMLAANRVGKTESVGLYEVVLHATGLYPPWWQGRVYNRPVRAWVAGDTGKTVREILQRKLLGAFNNIGSGLIPANLIVDTKRGAGVAESIEIIYVKHARGVSELVLKSYDQRREGFQGTEQDIILLDEEPPLDVYTECLLRTMTNNGMVLLTFTPLTGLSNVVLAFCEGGRVDRALPGKFVVTATWDDVPHLSDDAKKELWASIPPYQRDARSKGVPQLGSGAIYPIPESEIVVKPFNIPDHYPRVYGLDVGWNRTAAVWAARDLESGVWYLYAEHYKGQAEPVIHAQAIKARGEHMPGVIDPAARGRGQADGEALLDLYKELALDLRPANNEREAGLYEVWQALSTGQLKVFSTLQNWLAEYRIYRRDEKGKVVKDNDHLMDACVVGSTRVLTAQGPQRIDALVGTTGYVRSRHGVWARYVGARRTIVNSPTVRLTFADGYSVQCTPDHPFLTPQGWRRADTMLGQPCYTCVPRSIGTPSWIQWFTRQFAAPLMATPTPVDQVMTTSPSGGGATCIVKSGLTITGRLKTAFTFTTKMVTAAIIACVTYRRCPVASTSANTRKEFQSHFQPPHLPQPPRGTAAQPVARGTRNITRVPAPPCTSKVVEPANAAASSTEHSTGAETDFAAACARPAPCGKSAYRQLWLRNWLAYSVARVLWCMRRVIGDERYAGPATILCTDLQTATATDVYCLTVPGLSAFALENGCVVHNTRYLWMSGRALARQPFARKQRMKLRVVGDRENSTWMD